VRTTPLIGEKPWFGPRRAGWGFAPVSWEGWAVIAVFVAIAIAKGTSPGGRRARAAFERER
jgi:hypothetical protein